MPPAALPEGTESERIELRKAILVELRKYRAGQPNPTDGDPTQIALIDRHAKIIGVWLDHLLGFRYFRHGRLRGDMAVIEALDVLMGHVRDAEYKQRHLTVHSRGGHLDNARLASFTTGQMHVCSEINAYLANSSHAAIQAPFVTLSGATHLMSQLPYVENSAVGATYTLRPDYMTVYDDKNTGERVYDPALRALARHLLIKERANVSLKSLFPDLIDWVQGRNGLIIFASAIWLEKGRKEAGTVVPAESAIANKPLRSLLSGLRKGASSVPKGAPACRPCVMFMSPRLCKFTPPQSKKRGAMPDALTGGLKKSLLDLKKMDLHLILRSPKTLKHWKVPKAEPMLNLSYQQWKHYCKVRKVPYYFEIGPRLKTANFFYEQQARDAVWHRSIKMRSAIASNKAINGYTDANFGISKLLGGLKQDDPELACAIEDVRDHVAFLDDETRNTLREICSGQYYVWGSSLSQARQAQRRGATSDEDASLDYVDVEGLISGGHGDGIALIREIEVDGVPQYSAALDLRAIVLEDWADEIAQNLKAGDTSARDNWRILYQNAALDIAAQLAGSGDQVEVPISPFLDANTQIWPEVFRKLIWSVRHHDDVPPITGQDIGALHNLPLRDAVDAFAENPRAIYRLCFQRIFLRRFRNSRSASDAIFSRDDHADTIAAGMLELVSRDGKLGDPHPLLEDDLHDEYWLACAHVLMGLGDVQEAKACMTRGTDSAIRLLAFDCDTKTPEGIRELLAEKLKSHGLEPEGPAPRFEDIKVDQNSDEEFLAIIRMMLMTREEVDDIGVVLSEYACPGKLEAYGLHTPEVNARDAHRISYPWKRPPNTDSKILLMRLFALFHERKAEDFQAKGREVLAKNPKPKNGRYSRKVRKELNHLQDIRQNHLTKSGAFLDRCIGMVGELRYENERTRLRVARQRIERLHAQHLRRSNSIELERDRRLFASEGFINDIMRRPMFVGCSYDVYVDLLIESAYGLAECGRPIRAYCGFARPALELVDSIQYDGYRLEALECAEAMLDQVEALWRDSGRQPLDGGTRFAKEYVPGALQSQESLERIYGITDSLSVDLGDGGLDRLALDTDGEDKPPVFGFLLPQVKRDIRAFADTEAEIARQRRHIQAIRDKCGAGLNPTPLSDA